MTLLLSATSIKLIILALLLSLGVFVTRPDLSTPASSRLVQNPAGSSLIQPAGGSHVVQPAAAAPAAAGASALENATSVTMQ